MLVLPSKQTTYTVQQTSQWKNWRRIAPTTTIKWYNRRLCKQISKFIFRLNTLVVQPNNLLLSALFISIYKNLFTIVNLSISGTVNISQLTIVNLSKTLSDSTFMSGKCLLTGSFLPVHAAPSHKSGLHKVWLTVTPPASISGHLCEYLAQSACQLKMSV